MDINIDRNLLFGVQALQDGMLTDSQFLEACAVWNIRKTTPLADIVVDRGWLTVADRAKVDGKLEPLLNTPEALRESLRECLASTPHARRALELFNDPDVNESLGGEPGGRVLLSTVDEQPGTRDRYVLKKLHGKGGMGLVWRATDTRFERDVAFKELRPDRRGTKAAVARFVTEARVTGQLEHPSIVPVYDLVEDPSGQPYYTMRFFRGGTLADAARELHAGGPAPKRTLRGLVEAFETVCLAVAYAHDRGVIHRDLKGANVVLGDYKEVLVLDWGLAKVVGGATAQPGGPVDVAGAGEAYATVGEVGTPAYMAPEQARGGDADRRTDVYGLGAVLYEILTGRPPFVGADKTDVLRRVREEPLVPPGALAPATPAALAAVALKALAKEPGDRYESAAALAVEVRRWLDDEPVTAYADPFTVRAGRWAKRHRSAVAAAAAGLVVAAAGLAGVAVVAEEGRSNEARQREVAVGQAKEAEEARAKTEVALRGEQDAVRKAEAAAADARRARDEAADKAARVGLIQSNVFVSAGDWSAAVLPMAEVVRSTDESDRWRRPFRLRTALLTDGCPRLTQVWGHAKCASQAEFSPDGQRVLTVGDDGTARVWDSATGVPVTPPLKHTVPIRAAVAGWAMAATGWGVIPATRITDWPVPIEFANFNADGSRVVTAGRDQTAKVWSVADPAAPVATLPHDDTVAYAVFSRDGKRLVTATRHDLSNDEKDDWIQRQQKQTHAMLSGNMEGAFAALGGGTEVLYPGATRKVRVWDWEAGRAHVIDHAGPARGVAVSPAGDYFAVAGGLAEPDGKARIRLRNLATGAVAVSVPADFVPNHVLFTPDGRSLLAAGGTSLGLWAVSGQVVWPPAQLPQTIDHVAYSPDGRRLAVALAGGEVRAWDLMTTGFPMVTIRPADAVRQLAFSADGRTLLTVGAGDKLAEVRLWDARTGAAVGPSFGHCRKIQSAGFDPLGRRVVTAAADGVVRVWALPTAAPARLLDAGGAVVHAEFSPDGKRVVTAIGDEAGFPNRGEARVWDAATGKPVGAALRHAGPVNFAAFDPAGGRVVTAAFDKTARVWDAATGAAITAPLLHHDWVLHAGFSPDGGRVVTAAGTYAFDKGFTGNNRINGIGLGRLWDVATGNPVGKPLFHGAAAGFAAFSPDGRRVLLAGQSQATVWDAATCDRAVAKPLNGEIVRRVSVNNTGRVGQADWHRDSRRVVVGLILSTAVWDIGQGSKPLYQLQHDGHASHAAFSPDGRRVVTADDKGTARVWNAADGRPVTPPLAHPAEVVQAAFSRDGRLLVTACQDGAARLWDAETGTPLGPPLWHADPRPTGPTFDSEARAAFTPGGGPLVVAAFSPDGGRAITAGGHDVALWELTPDPRPVAELDEAAQLLAGRRYDSSGLLVPLDPAEVRQLWAACKARRPEAFRDAPDADRAWHAAEARACEAAADWAGAVWHLDRLQRQTPDDASLLARIAAAAVRGGNTEGAIWAARRAIDRGLGDDPDVAADLARALANAADEHSKAGRLKEAETALEEARDRLQKTVNDKTAGTAAVRSLGKVYGQLGALLRQTDRPKEAVAALQQAVELIGGKTSIPDLPPATRADLWQPCRDLARAYVASGDGMKGFTYLVLAVEFSTGVERAEVLLDMAETMARNSDHAEVGRAAADVGRQPEVVTRLFNKLSDKLDLKLATDEARMVGVGLYAVAVAAALADAKTPPDDRPKLADAYAAKAVDALLAAEKDGYFNRPGALKHFCDDPRLAALRDRPAVKQFLDDRRDR